MSSCAPRPARPRPNWFTEGFTDYYAALLLYRARLTTLDEYVATLDELIAQYSESPVRELPNAKIGAAFWTSHDVEQLPYLRGRLVACALDRELRRHGGSLDDFMRARVAEARRGASITTDGLRAAVAAATSEPFAARLRATIVDGATLSIELDLFAPCLTGMLGRVATFNLGFDFERSRAASLVAAVAPGSAAERAGLRDGQHLRGFSIYRDPSSPPRSRSMVAA